MRKLISNIFILISAFLLTGQFAFSQNTVNGKITSAKTHEAIPGVAVFITELQRGVLSDETGKFTFENLPNTTLHIQFTVVGFKSVVKILNPEINSLDVAMEPSATELEEVLVTSNNAKLPDNIPFPASSISQTELRRHASPSVMGNLGYQPGVDKITIGNGIGKPVIRGLSFNQIMLYGQGTRIENQQWDDHHDLGLSDIGISNVEIVHGPAALIYGADALGGALIFHEEKPAAAGTTMADANLGFGSNTLGINADAGLKSSRKNGVFYGLRVGGTSQTSYLQGEGEEQNKPAGEEEEEFAPNSKSMNIAAKGNIGVSKKWGVSKLSYSFLNQQIGIVEDESADTASAKNDEEEQRDREFEAPYQDVTTQIISVENTFFTGKSTLNVNLAYQLNDRKEFEPLPFKQKELAIGLKLNVTTFDIKWNSNASKDFGVTLGTQGTLLKNENIGKEALVPNADVTDFAGYGLFRFDHDKLNLLGGVRFDSRHIEAESYEDNPALEEYTFILHSSGNTIAKPETDFEKDYTPVSFSIGASYHAGEHFTLKLNAATGFSAPNYAQLGTFGKHEGTFRFERGDTKLNVEQNMEVDPGIIWENEFITFNLGGFLNKVKDYIYIVNTGDSMIRSNPDGKDTLPIYDYKQGDVTLSGVEAGFDIHPNSAKWLDFSAGYSMTSGKLDAAGNLPYIPAGKLIGEIKLMKEKMGKLSDAYFSLIASNYSKQTKVTEYELSTEGYTLLDAHVGSFITLGKHKYEFGIFCTNLLNTAYFNQLSLIKYIGVRDMGRNIGVQLHIPLYASKK